MDQKVITFHCIIHQEALCAHIFLSEMMEVMTLVQIVDKILAKRLNHRQFCELLDEVNCQYSDLLLHNKVRWLFKRMELKTFLRQKGQEYEELDDPQWLQKL